MKRNLTTVEQPFVCDAPNCIMKCTTENQLEHHKKSHDIRLNVSNKFSNFVDQTPTPTRFIRNCEEVGLFQDLQNVNPFDETFRKAMEDPKSDDTSLKPRESNIGLALDDTLHTPVVFHPSQDQKPSTNVPTTSTCSCQPSPIKKEKVQSERWEDKPHIFLLDRNVALKLPISRLVTSSRPTMKVFHPKAFSVMSSNSAKMANKTKRPDNAEKKDDKSLELKESNRMAAVRSREKKKHYIAYMEELNRNLTEKLERMEAVVASLTSENASLKKQLELCNERRFGQGRLGEIAVELSGKSFPSTSSIREEQRSSFYASIPSSERGIPLNPEEHKKVDFILRKPIKKRSVPPNQC